MAPEANPFEGNNFLIDKLRQLIPNLNYPESTFEIQTEDCPEGSIRIMALQTLEGPQTGYLTCEEVSIVIDIANEVAGASMG